MLHDVVEDLWRSQQQPPVEAHRTARGAARPAGALAPDLQPLVAPPGAGHGGVEPRRHLESRLPPVPGLEGVRQGVLGSELHRQRRAAPRQRARGSATAPPRTRSESRSPRYGTSPPSHSRAGGNSASDSRIRRSVRSIHGRFSRTNGSTLRRGKWRGSTTSTPSASTWIRACRARFERLIRYGGAVTGTRLDPRSVVGHSSTYLRSGRGRPTTSMAASSFPLRRRSNFQQDH